MPHQLPEWSCRGSGSTNIRLVRWPFKWLGKQGLAEKGSYSFGKGKPSPGTHFPKQPHYDTMLTLLLVQAQTTQHPSGGPTSPRPSDQRRRWERRTLRENLGHRATLGPEATKSTLPGTQTRLCAGHSDLKQPPAEAERCRLHAVLGKVLTLGVGPSATSKGPRRLTTSWLTTRLSRWEETR